MTQVTPPPLDTSPSGITARREFVFLILAGIFLGTLAMLNILGISRFITLAGVDSGQASGITWKWGQPGEISFMLAVGVLPYPITFLCTDLISELYGKKRANWTVTVGLLLNVWVIFILWLGGILPEVPEFDPQTNLPATDDPAYVFYAVRAMAFGAVFASMIAYMAAQFCDVWLYHFWKTLTKGKHLWLRNNGSTLVSQLVDTSAVILISHFYAGVLPISDSTNLWSQLVLYILTGYVFKLLIALLDTIPMYILTGILRRFLHIEPI